MICWVGFCAKLWDRVFTKPYTRSFRLIQEILGRFGFGSVRTLLQRGLQGRSATCPVAGFQISHPEVIFPGGFCILLLGCALQFFHGLVIETFVVQNPVRVSVAAKKAFYSGADTSRCVSSRSAYTYRTGFCTTKVSMT